LAIAGVIQLHLPFAQGDPETLLEDYRCNNATLLFRAPIELFSSKTSPPVGKPGLYEQIENYSMRTTLPKFQKIDGFCSPFFYVSSTQGKLQSGGYTHLALFSRKNLR
jgi:hypothetical protein